MANLILDGFDWMPAGLSDSDLSRLWAANNFFSSGSGNATVETGRFGDGKALSVDVGLFGSSGPNYVVPVGAQPATGFIGCGMKIYPDQGSSDATVLAFYDGVNDTNQLIVRYAANGVVKVYNGAATTLLAYSEPGAFQEDEWFHTEVKGLVANTGGTCEVRINTVPVVQLTGADTQNTANAYFDCIRIGGFQSGLNGSQHYAIDDLFVNDTTGTENNDWSGNLRVKSQFMIANGFTNNFSIGGSSPAATHWQSVLNQLLDDTKFEYSSTPGDIDLFTPDPNLNSPLVRALQVRLGLRQDDATQRMAHAMLRIAGTNYEGSKDLFTNQTFTFYKDRWELNPNTGVSFTGADVNGLQAGGKLVT